MLFYGLSGAVALLIKFEGVDYVLPDTIESSSNGCHRSQVGVAQPDQEAGILLAEGLASCGLIGMEGSSVVSLVCLFASQSSDGELR